ncbi:MAG: AtpZ/AtpI family protein [Pyrinomonadaceae bacterium]
MSMNEEEILNDEAERRVDEAVKADSEPMLFQTSFKPESQAETIRKSGLAYSAGLALAGSVIFLLIIGWILDSFLGTSPWCLLGGIVLGSIIGFFQFFRLTSKILKP